MKKVLVVIATALLTMLFTGCALMSEERVKLKDLDFTILGEEKIPEELMSIINDKKAEPFKLTYSDQDYLYICIGYGEKTTGGYSIAVNELYLTDNAVYVNTELLGPDPSEKTSMALSYPYIVIKTDYLDQTVIFE